MFPQEKISVRIGKVNKRESKIKGGHVRRASGPCGTRRPAHVCLRTVNDADLRRACFQANTVHDFFAALRRGPARAMRTVPASLVAFRPSSGNFSGSLRKGLGLRPRLLRSGRVFCRQTPTAAVSEKTDHMNGSK